MCYSVLVSTNQQEMVKSFAQGMMDYLIDPSWWTHSAISHSSQCSTTGVTKDMVCAVMSMGWCI